MDAAERGGRANRGTVVALCAGLELLGETLESRRRRLRPNRDTRYRLKGAINGFGKAGLYRRERRTTRRGLFLFHNPLSIVQLGRELWKLETEIYSRVFKERRYTRIEIRTLGRWAAAAIA